MIYITYWKLAIDRFSIAGYECYEMCMISVEGQLSYTHINRFNIAQNLLCLRDLHTLYLSLLTDRSLSKRMRDAQTLFIKNKHV